MTFIHTADWQIGKPFAGIADDDKRAAVRKERIEAIARLGRIAQEKGASFVLVAGDVFDSATPDKATVSAMLASVGSMGRPVYAIPGNHDHGGAGSVWEQDFFRREQAALAPNLHVLLKAEPVECGGVMILPCPLLRKREPLDLTAWLRVSHMRYAELPEDTPRIVLAHGSVQDFQSGSDADDEEISTSENVIDLSRLPEDELDYIALGDWHGVKQVGARAWYAGTPEIDRFPKGDGNMPGHVLAVDVTRGQSPVVETVKTGTLGWHEHAQSFFGDDALPLFDAWVAETFGSRTGMDLLKLTLEGALGIEAFGRLERTLETLDSRLLRLKCANRVSVAPTDAELEKLTRQTGNPLIAGVATQLMDDAKKDGEQAEVARLALRELYRRVCA